jgi:hypothetical protein
MALAPRESEDAPLSLHFFPDLLKAVDETIDASLGQTLRVAIEFDQQSLLAVREVERHRSVAAEIDLLLGSVVRLSPVLKRRARA